MESQQSILAEADGQTFLIAQAEHGATGPIEGEQEGDIVAGEHAVEEGELPGAHEEEHHGLPPELWLVLALVVVIAVAFRPAKKAILSALDSRAERIRGELEEAQRLREEAQAALANFQRRQRDAMGEAEEIITHARQEAERLKAKTTADLEEVLKRREAQAMDRISQAEATALAEVRGIAADVAIAAARQVIAANLDKERSNVLVDRSIEELPGKLH